MEVIVGEKYFPILYFDWK